MTPQDLLSLDSKIPEHLRPSNKLIAIGILNSNLKQIIELQTMLASQGVVMTLSTAEIQYIGDPDGNSHTSETSRT